MIFTSQSGLIDTTRGREWDAWYADHLRVMMTVNGIDSAQRFLLVAGDNSPSLAMYSVASHGVFDDPHYLSIRGLGEWEPLIDWRYYRRNLFAGLDRAPVVQDSQFLLVCDRSRPEPDAGAFTWTWLEAVGIDRSTPWRGIAVAEKSALPALYGRHIDIYRPAGSSAPR